MEFLTLLLVIVILLLLLNYKSGFSDRMDALQDQLSDLQQQLFKTTIVQPPPPVIPAPPPVTTPAPASPPVVEAPPPVIQEKPAPPPVRKLPDTPPRPQPLPRPSFFGRHPDLEKFIGENLISKIGIGILVLAIGFFVKYAIDKEWIGPPARVGIGILCGSILITIAHRLRKSYKAFSSVLVGGGIAILYFTITLAFHQFHLFGQTTSFIMLVIITGFTVILSLLYNRQELAVIALIGGLASPFMVSNGEASFFALFTYLVILNAGLLLIAYNKMWRTLNISAFILTVLVFTTTSLTMAAKMYPTGLLFATILYLLFFAINVASNIKENKAFIAADFSILLINTALYFSAGMLFLTGMKLTQYQGLFSAALAAINLIISYLLFKTRKADTNILYLFIGLTLTFVSLTAPIQLNGHYITLFWSAEAVMLYWLYQKSGIQLMRLTSFVISAAMMMSLFMDWPAIYGTDTKMPIIINKGFITTLSAAISCWLFYTLLSKNKPTQQSDSYNPASLYKFTSIVLLFIAGLLEVNHQFSTRYPDTSLNTAYIMLYIPIFVLLFHAVTQNSTRYNTNWKIRLVLLSVTIIIYLISYPEATRLQTHILTRHTIPGLHFAAHWAAAVCTGILLYNIITICRYKFSSDLQTPAAWILSAATVLFLSQEIFLATNALFYSPQTPLETIQEVYDRAGLSVLWGLLSFTLMWLGMRKKVRTLRIISLSFFTVTLIKLFLFDIREITPAGKIAAFFSLGVLLLIISFMYQKVKKIIIEDEKPAEE